MTETPRRGDVWLVDLGQPVGHEAGFTRPSLVVSDDQANVHGLVVLCPVGSTSRNYPTRVEMESGQSGLDEISYVQVEQIRTVSRDRLVHRLGVADLTVLAKVDRAMRFLLRL